MWSWCTVFVLFVIIVLPLSTCTPVPPTAQYFGCGHDICKEAGYDICIAPPLVSKDIDSYCMPCKEFKKSCGTTNEQVGCNLYCQDLLSNNLDRRVKELEAENAKLREKNCGDAFTDFGWCIAFGVLVTVLFFLTITYFVCRRIKHNRKKKKNGNIDNLSSSSNCSDSTPLSDGTADGEEKEEENDCNTTQNCYGAQKLRNVNPTQDEAGKIAISAKK